MVRLAASKAVIRGSNPRSHANFSLWRNRLKVGCSAFNRAMRVQFSLPLPKNEVVGEYLGLEISDVETAWAVVPQRPHSPYIL